MSAKDSANDFELWRATRDGVSRVDDIWPGSDGSDPQRLSRFGKRLYFNADDGSRGRELWLWEP